MDNTVITGSGIDFVGRGMHLIHVQVDRSIWHKVVHKILPSLPKKMRDKAQASWPRYFLPKSIFLTKCMEGREDHFSLDRTFFEHLEQMLPELTPPFAYFGEVGFEETMALAVSEVLGIVQI